MTEPADFVRHSCGERVFVDEWQEHVAGCTRIAHDHTLTVAEDGSTYITQHLDDPGFNLLSGCYIYKAAHHAFESALDHRRHTPRATPRAGVYRIALGDDSNLHVFGRLGDSEVPA